MGTGQWESQTRAAFERFLADLKATLPPDASFADIERALLKFSRAFLRETAEALANVEDFSPSEQANP